MAKKKKPPPSGPSNAYLMSFGDTMTTLLAFFIVLNSLAQDQTGANLHAGTGSFMKTLASGGMQTNLIEDRQKSLIKMDNTRPLYVVPDEENREPDGSSLGPDDKDDGVRVIDREKEDFERFVNELKKLSEMKEQPDVLGEAVFDYFNRLGKEGPLLTEEYRAALAEVIPLLYQPNYLVEVIVWATTPKTSAWKRAAIQADTITSEIAKLGALNPRQKKRLRGTAKLWFDKDAKRPVVSIVTRKM
ncbi:MAG: flagellar motor protein MotB [Planctomycetota bacterium]